WRVDAHRVHLRGRARGLVRVGALSARCAAPAMIDAPGFWPLVEARAQATPDALCAIDERGARLSFGELHARAERGAAALAERGVAPDVRVSWQLPTWIESLVLVAAAARLGAVQNPLLPIYREREIGFIARQVRPTLLVVAREFRGCDHAALARRVL